MMAKRNETTKTQTVNALQARIADLKALLASYQNAGTNLAAAQAAQQTRQAQEWALQEVENQVQGVKQTSSAVTLSKVSNRHQLRLPNDNCHKLATMRGFWSPHWGWC